MSGRQRTFKRATTAPTADTPQPAPEAAETPEPAPVRPITPDPTRSAVSVDAGAPVATGARVPRTPGHGLDDRTRRRWRNELRASAGKLASTLRAAADAEDDWADTLDRASAEGVPLEMVTAALHDAGAPEDYARA